MTPATLETAARRMLNAVGEKFWTSEEIIEDYIYFAALELATETFCIENRYTTAGVANQTEYALASRAIAVKRVEWDSRKLRPITLLQLDAIDTNTNTTVTGTPQYYYNFDEAIGLYPAPSTSGETIKIYTYDEPSALTTSSTKIEIPSQFHGYLAIGTAFYMALKEVGHPNVGRLEFQWNGPGNRNNCIIKTRRSVRMRNKDQLHTVIREDQQPGTHLGMV